MGKTHPASDARTRLLARLATRRSELEQVVAPLRTRLSAVAQPDGTQVRDLLAHLACWQRVAERRLRTLARGGEIQLLDADQVNETFARLTGFWTDDEVLAEFDAAYHALMEVVASAPEEEYRRGGYVHRFRRPADGHYDDHLPALQAVVGD